MTAVVPSTSLTLQWNPPTDNGCLPILSYVIAKNGVDLATVITANQHQLVDNISVGGAIGTSITYKIKAINEAGASLYTED